MQQDYFPISIPVKDYFLVAAKSISASKTVRGSASTKTGFEEMGILYSSVFALRLNVKLNGALLPASYTWNSTGVS